MDGRQETFDRGEGHWDYLTVDPTTHRIYLPASEKKPDQFIIAVVARH